MQTMRFCFEPKILWSTHSHTFLQCIPKFFRLIFMYLFNLWKHNLFLYCWLCDRRSLCDMAFSSTLYNSISLFSPSRNLLCLVANIVFILSFIPQNTKGKKPRLNRQWYMQKCEVIIIIMYPALERTKIELVVF